MASALVEFARLERDRPDDPDVATRHGILLALSGDTANARRRFGACYNISGAWRELVRRLAVAGFLPDDSRLL